MRQATYLIGARGKDVANADCNDAAIGDPNMLLDPLSFTLLLLLPPLLPPLLILGRGMPSPRYPPKL
jgi:hypothetical protein